ncbi:hypothetical protein STEG23_028252 [Scotinomys teguina]
MDPAGLKAKSLCACWLDKDQFAVDQVLHIPDRVAQFSWALEPIFSSSEPTREARVGMGATVDIQRQQRMEQLDRQLMLSQFAQYSETRPTLSAILNLEGSHQLTGKVVSAFGADCCECPERPENKEEAREGTGAQKDETGI